MSHDRTIHMNMRRLRDVPGWLEARDRALTHLYLDAGAEKGTLSHAALGAIYGLSETTVRNAIHRWRPVILAEQAASARGQAIAG